MVRPQRLFSSLVLNFLCRMSKFHNDAVLQPTLVLPGFLLVWFDSERKLRGQPKTRFVKWNYAVKFSYFIILFTSVEESFRGSCRAVAVACKILTDQWQILAIAFVRIACLFLYECPVQKRQLKIWARVFLDIVGPFSLFHRNMQSLLKQLEKGSSLCCFFLFVTVQDTQPDASLHSLPPPTPPNNASSQNFITKYGSEQFGCFAMP